MIGVIGRLRRRRPALRPSGRRRRKPTLRLAYGPVPVIGLVAALALVAVVVAAVGTAAGGNGGDPAAGSGRPVADAPGLAGRTLDGEPFDLAELRGQVVLVNVFASWCGPCQDELPLLVDAGRRWSGRDLRLVGLAVRDSEVALRALLERTGARDLAVLPDPAGSTAVDWGVRGVPETFLLDRHGRIVDRMIGPVTARWLDERLAPLLGP
ncbi:TlpA family protein disulfide reductase [Plantactinospora sp. WMMB334]|uniref:TlpA family protein disulfide reductase n=1 Tax=Plantactinospora sp. WMMB334 TaxID=3404119 RepID=UPI003B962711